MLFTKGFWIKLISISLWILIVGTYIWLASYMGGETPTHFQKWLKVCISTFFGGVGFLYLEKIYRSKTKSYAVDALLSAVFIFLGVILILIGLCVAAQEKYGTISIFIGFTYAAIGFVAVFCCTLTGKRKIQQASKHRLREKYAPSRLASLYFASGVSIQGGLMSKSPYLNDQRLADVIAAIQVMSTYKFYKLDFCGWSKRITGSESNAEYWKAVFIEHPEFFRLNQEQDKVSLVWRRSHQRNFHVDRQEILTREKIDFLPEEEKNARLSRTPLSNGDTATLISTAVDLHTRAIESEKEKRWLLPSLVTILAVCLGAIIKSWS